MPKYHKSRNPINTAPFFNAKRRSNMPSQRRIKVYGLLFFVAIISLLFYATRSSSSPTPSAARDSFYSKTKTALDAKGVAALAEHQAKQDEEEVKKGERQQRLRDAEAQAKTQANKKSPKPENPGEIVGVGNSADAAGSKDGTKGKSVAGRKKYAAEGAGQEVMKDGEKKEEDEVMETPERRAARTELGVLLKKAPIIIFSKSYCPHSARAKRILLDEYMIEPKPYVVELDLHDQGPEIQLLLAERTGRRTVPNVLVNGVSIGGGDDMAALAAGRGKRGLEAKLMDLGAKKVTMVHLRDVEVKAEAGKAAEGHEAHQGHGLR